MEWKKQDVCTCKHLFYTLFNYKEAKPLCFVSSISWWAKAARVVLEKQESWLIVAFPVAIRNQLVWGFCGLYWKWLRHRRTHVSCCWFDLQPLYGLLQAKLQLITHAYFEEKDFSQISILKVRISPDRNVFVDVKRLSIHLLSPLTLQELYDHMNSSLRGSALDGSQVYLGR